MRNLAENALRHARRRVVVRLAPGPILSVEDDGPGIPVEEREAFFRRTRGQGSGLGLTLVRRVAEAHGGWSGWRKAPWAGRPSGWASSGVALRGGACGVAGGGGSARSTGPWGSASSSFSSSTPPGSCSRGTPSTIAPR
ncbi:sensor histidine kinase [Thermus thermophilus]|uniref:sensor histidine kinase n=1 Tax=Thermus thermophilus TaxID=274 RepID=UPI003BAD635C